MADELSINLTLSYSKGGDSVRISDTWKEDISGDGHIDNVQNIGTSEESVTLGDISTPGYVFIENLDSTNYVEIAATTTEYCVKLGAGQMCLFPLDGTTLFAKANTAACNVRFLAIPT